MKWLNKEPLARDVESREPWGTDAGAAEEGKGKTETRGERLLRSVFWVLRKDEVREGEQREEEVERRVDVVEDKLEGCREGQEDGCDGPRGGSLEV